MTANVNLAEFEAAVLVVTSSGGHPQLSAATNYIHQLSTLPESYQLCVQLLLGTNHAQARFFALQGLEQFIKSAAYAVLDVEKRHAMRSALLEYCRSRCLSCQLAAEEKYVRTKLALVFAIMIRVDYPEHWPSAFADLFHLIHACGGFVHAPSPRGSATGHPLGLPSLPALCATDIVLRVLSTLHSEVVDPRINRTPAETARNTVVKDAMRLRGDTATLADMWYTLLTTCAPAIAATEAAYGIEAGKPLPPSDVKIADLHVETAVGCCRAALQCMASYADWCDIKLFTHDAAVRLHMQLLGSSYLRELVSRVLLALVEKGADPGSRLSLLQALQLVEVTRLLTVSVEDALHVADTGGEIDECPYGRTGYDESDADYGDAVATLAAAVTGVLIEAGETPSLMANANASAWTAASFRTCVELLLRLLNHSCRDRSLGVAVLPTVNMLVACLQKEMRPAGVKPGKVAGAASASTAGTPMSDASGAATSITGPAGRPAGVSCAEFMPALLAVVVRQFTWPDDLDPPKGEGVEEDEDDYGEEAQFRSLREGLRKVFINLARIAPEGVLGQLTGAAPAPLVQYRGSSAYADTTAAAPWAPAALAGLGEARFEVAERALVLLYLYAEGAGITVEGSTAAAQLRARAGPLHDAVVTALGCAVASKPGQNPVVVISYFELAARYATLLLPVPPGTKRPDGSDVQAIGPGGQGLLPGVLEALLGAPGLRNPAPSVRGRTAYLLLKLVKSVSKASSFALAPYAMGILNAIAEYLTVKPPTLPVGAAGAAGGAAGGAGQPHERSASSRLPSTAPAGSASATAVDGTRGASGLGFDDTEFLFETAGVLLGMGAPTGTAGAGSAAGPGGSGAVGGNVAGASDGPPGASSASGGPASLFIPLQQRIAFVEAVLRPLLMGIDSALAPILSTSANGSTNSFSPAVRRLDEDTALALGGYVVRCLSAVGHVTKGFGSVHGIERLAVLQEWALAGALRAVLALPGVPGLRPKVMFLLHRLVDCLDTRILRSLPACLPVLLGLGLPPGTPVPAPVATVNPDGSPAAPGLAHAQAMLEACMSVEPASLVPSAPTVPEDVGAVFTLLMQAVGKFGAKEAAGVAAALQAHAQAVAAGQAAALPIPSIAAAAPLLSFLNRWLLALAARVATVMPPPSPGLAAMQGQAGSVPALGGLSGSASVAGYGPGYRRLRKQSDMGFDGQDGDGAAAVVSDDSRARIELWRAWVLFLHQIAGVAGVATTVMGQGPPSAALPRLLGTLLDPLTAAGSTPGAGPDPAISKMCLQTMSLLVKAWLPVSVQSSPSKAATGAGQAGPGPSGVTAFPAAPSSQASTHPVKVTSLPSPLEPGVLNAFTRWMLDDGLAATWRCALAPGIDPADAQAAAMLAEAIGLQATMAVHVAAATGAPPPSTAGARAGGQGVDAIGQMVERTLPALGCALALAAAYADRLRACLNQPKDARAQYLAVLQDIRAKQNRR